MKRNIVNEIIHRAGALLMVGALLAFAACSDGSDDSGNTQKTDSTGKKTEENANGETLCMINTSWTENQTITSETTFGNFGKGAYLVYPVPVTSSSSLELSAHIKFSTLTNSEGNGAQNGGIGFIEVSGSEAVSSSIGYSSEVGVKSETSGGTLTYTGGQGYSPKNQTAQVDTEYVAKVTISGGKWTIAYYNDKGRTLYWSKNSKWSDFYKDTSTVYLALGGSDTSSVTYWNVQVKNGSTTKAVTDLKYNALAGLVLKVDDTSVTKLTVASQKTQEIVVQSTDRGEPCAWTAVSSHPDIVSVTPASGSSSDTKLTLSTHALGSATITVTNAVNTALKKTIVVTVADYPRQNASYVLTAAQAYPVAGQTGAYPDGTFRLTFDEDISLSDGGFATIFKYAEGEATEIDRIHFVDEVQTAQNTDINVGAQLSRVDGKNLYLTPHFNALEGDATYFIAIPEAVIFAKDTSDKPHINGIAFDGLSSSYDASNGWYFTTKASATVSTSKTITVNSAESSTADFRSLQAALATIDNDKTLDIATNTFEIALAAGDYYEFIYYKGDANIKIVGQGDTRDDTVIRYVNCNDMNGTTHRRAVFYFGGGSDLWLENLTIKNLTERKTKYITTIEPSTASQAEAIYFANGNDTDTGLAKAAFVAHNCAFYSHQDTIQTTGKNWFYDCYIEGDVDFLWGTAEVALFENCELVSSLDENRGETSDQHLIVARTGLTKATAIGKGYVVLGGTLEIQNGVTCYLGRCAGAGDFYDQAAVVNTEIKGDGTLPAVLWDTSTYVYLTNYAEHVGWKVYGMTKAGSAVNTTEKATNTAVVTDDVYTAEYSTREKILNRVYNTTTHSYVDDTTAAWDSISVWKLDAVESVLVN